MSLSESQAAVEASAKAIYAATTRSYAYAPWSLADQEPFLRVARAALEAAEAAQGSAEWESSSVEHTGEARGA